MDVFLSNGKSSFWGNCGENIKKGHLTEAEPGSEMSLTETPAYSALAHVARLSASAIRSTLVLSADGCRSRSPIPQVKPLV